MEVARLEDEEDVSVEIDLPHVGIEELAKDMVPSKNSINAKTDKIDDANFLFIFIQLIFININLVKNKNLLSKDKL